MNEDRLRNSEKQMMIRNFLRVTGISCFGLGLIFTAIGVISFFSSFAAIASGNGFAGGTPSFPKYFWCCFVGIPLMGLGGWLSMFGFMGAIQRFIAGETAPVSKDVINYMGENIQPGVKAVVKAAAEGIWEARNEAEKQQEHRA